MAYRIEQDVPPPTSRRGGRHSKYPFGAMRPGSSFAVDVDDGDASLLARNLRAAAAAWAKRHAPGLKFTAARSTENGVLRVRVWCAERAGS